MSFPTWFLTWLFRPFFRRDHPWLRHRHFTLREWHVGQTKACREFDCVFWVFGVVLVFLSWVMFGHVT